MLECRCDGWDMGWSGWGTRPMWLASLPLPCSLEAVAMEWVEWENAASPLLPPYSLEVVAAAQGRAGSGHCGGRGRGQQHWPCAPLLLADGPPLPYLPSTAGLTSSLCQAAPPDTGKEEQRAQADARAAGGRGGAGPSWGGEAGMLWWWGLGSTTPGPMRGGRGIGVGSALKWQQGRWRVRLAQPANGGLGGAAWL